MSLYDDLGVSPDADADAIRKAHRKGVQKHHPDKGGEREEFDKVQRAYLILRDPKTRQRYDETGEDEVAPDNELAEIANLIVSAFDMATASCGGAFDKIDLAAEMRRGLASRLTDAEEMLANLKAGVDAIEKIGKRLSYKGDRSDVIGSMLRGRLEENRKAQATVSKQIEDIERAQAYAADYGYEFTAPAPPGWSNAYDPASPYQRRGGTDFFNNVFGR